MTTELLDSAIATVKTAARDLPRDLDPADLSAQIAAARELAWALDHFVKTIAGRYERLDGPLRHDQGGDPAVAVEMVRLRLGDITARLDETDQAFAEAHNHAARLSCSSETALTRPRRTLPGSGCRPGSTARCR